MKPRAATVARLALLFGVAFVLYLVGTQPDVQAYFELEHLRGMIARAGLIGMLGYVALFAAGNMVQVPALVFISLALLAWGPLTGGALALVGSLAATSVSYWTVRSVGGSPLAEVDNRWVRALLAQLDDHPIRTLVLGRAILYMSPVLNYPLALSGMRFRDYLLGSALGFIAPIAVIALALDTALQWIGAA